MTGGHLGLLDVATLRPLASDSHGQRGHEHTHRGRQAKRPLLLALGISRLT